MINQYFDNEETKRILELSKRNIDECIKEYQEYIRKYPKDYTNRPYYISQLITIRELEVAKFQLEKLQDAAYADEEFTKIKNRVYRFKYNVFFSKLKAKMYEGNYHSAYELIINNEWLINKFDGKYQVPLLMCQVKTGINKPHIEIKDDFYTLKQISNYSEDEFLDKMNLHIDDGSDIGNRFSKDFPFAEFYKRLKSNEIKGNKLYLGFIDNTTYYKFDRCGYVNGIETDYFRTVALHGTDDYLVIYPTLEGQNMRYTDLNNTLSKNKSKIYIPDNKNEYL